MGTLADDDRIGRLQGWVREYFSTFPVHSEYGKKFYRDKKFLQKMGARVAGTRPCQFCGIPPSCCAVSLPTPWATPKATMTASR